MGVRSLITGVFDELLAIAKAQGCQFKSDFREQTMETMILPAEASSIMYQDFLARRPMEIETFLGSPIKLAQEVGVAVPRIETLYALLHNINVTNQTKPPVSPSVPQQAQQPPSSARLIWARTERNCPIHAAWTANRSNEQTTSHDQRHGTTAKSSRVKWYASTRYA